MNQGNSGPRQVAGESSLQSRHRANKRRRHDQNGGGDERDGQKWPLGKVELRSFECPFCKLDPHRYAECKGYQLTRLSDVMQHISRQHRILEITLGSDETVREQDVILYCTKCRHLFYGMRASHKRDIHMNREIGCQPANIEQTGVMLDGEYEGLRSKLRSYPRYDETFRWNIIWKWCFPEKPCPPSPYVEISVSRAEVQSIIQDELESIPDLSQEQVQSVVRRSAYRIFNTSLESRSGLSVPPQAQSNIMQTASVPNYGAPIYMPPNQAFTSQSWQSHMQAFAYGSGLPNAGVYATSNTFTNNSAPSPAPGSRAHATSGNNFVHAGSGYPTVPYIQYPTDSFESQNQDHEYGNTTGRRGSDY
ncbi:hypothetical protein FAGAP_6429 [Fusarium agapanthi]|uniref:C2H2-type domain-containing protein n=1 Tax=Fusarium agapanthi TaxID=1803897 RepID=A0A9P5EDY8_9HYPO|nr:hypothetical protein FAGAP_6429 [Fusarium agapanthi]